MTSQAPRIRRHAARLTALLILLALYGFTRNPSLPANERAELAAQFHFERITLPAPAPAVPARSVRQVHPSFYNHASWVAAIGASVALADLDGDARPNDLCSVDPRADQVLVAPVPGTGQRFAAFILKPDGVAYEARTMAPMGCMVGDYNEDGAADLLVYYWGRTPVVFLRRAGAGLDLGSAGFRALELVAPYKIWNTAVATQADFDGDGHIDLVFGNYFQDGAKVLDAAGTGTEAMQDSMSRAFNGGINRIFLWAGAGSGAEPEARFHEAEGAFEPEVAAGWTLSVGAADLDGDMLPEIYFGNDFGPDRLLYNRSRPGQVRFSVVEGHKGFTTPSSKVLGHDSFKGMGVDFGDIDGDGQTDIYVSNIANEFALQESHFAFINTGEPGAFKAGRAPFVDRGEGLGLAHSAFSWEARLADFNNDGVNETMQATGFVRGTVNRWPELQELAMANDRLIHNPRFWPRFRPGDDISGHLHNPFFVRSHSGRFFDLAHEVGIDEAQVSRGIATADVDGDGDLDFAVANQWEDSYLYVNKSAGAGASLSLRLLLPVGAEPVATQVASGLPRNVAGRPAIGAHVVVHLPDGRLLKSEIDGGNGHSGDRSQDLHFGLGKAGPSPMRVEIAWRDSRGVVHRTDLQLAAGWHTVLLGSGKENA